VFLNVRINKINALLLILYCVVIKHRKEFESCSAIMGNAMSDERKPQIHGTSSSRRSCFEVLLASCVNKVGQLHSYVESCDNWHQIMMCGLQTRSLADADPQDCWDPWTMARIFLLEKLRTRADAVPEFVLVYATGTPIHANYVTFQIHEVCSFLKLQFHFAAVKHLTHSLTLLRPLHTEFNVWRFGKQSNITDWLRIWL